MSAFYYDFQTGRSKSTDGQYGPARLDNQRNVAVADAHGDYHDAATAGNVYSLYLNATSSTVAAGNIEAAAAAASTQFALWNPANSGYVLSLLKFGLGVISGTPTGGGVTHSLSIGHAISIAPSGTVLNHKTGATGGCIAGYLASAAGSNLTGSIALKALRVANFASTATAQASVNAVSAVEPIDGDIVLYPGMAWVPTWRGAGTTLLNNYSITWEEVQL